MQQLSLPLPGLTWKAAFRFRLFLVLAFPVAGGGGGFAAFIKDDGTARGFTQILLTYTLTVDQRSAGALHAVACLRYAGARYRRVPNSSGGGEANLRGGKSGLENGWALLPSTRFAGVIRH